MELLSSVASEDNPECLDLFELLQSPHLQGLLYSHDIIAQKDYLPKLPEVPPAEEYDVDEA
ncbi:unnamed protein product, partial [Allacma fusca]